MYIGIDLGGTNIAGGLVTTAGEIVSKISVPTGRERGSDAVIEDIYQVVESLMKANQTGEQVKGIGIGIPGIADPHTGEVIVCVNLNWYNVPLRAKLTEKTPLPIFIDNDATVAGVAEFQVAQEGKYKDAVILTLGTGVGGGVLVDGKVVSGHHGIGSELGHMLIGESLYTCNCGRNGCLETFASSTAIIHYAKHLIHAGRKSSMMDAVCGDIDKISGEVIFAAAREGDVVAVEVIRRLVTYLSRGIMNIVCTLDPEIVFLGGGLSMAGDFLLNQVKTELDGLKYFKATPHAKVEIAKFKNDAGIIGAAMYAMIQR
ncbi:MAG TPA: glucokinase [Clostridiales bacterium UBA8960]|nr:glucokinase [Clostridiales bacterium UBA8960]